MFTKKIHIKFTSLHKVIAVISFLFFLTNCGINLKYKTPEKPTLMPIFTFKDSLKGYNYFQRSCYDVIHYDIHLSFNIAEKSIGGFVETSFNLNKESSEIQIDLDEQYVIDSITQNGAELKYKRIYTAIVISLNLTNKQQRIKVYYHGVPKKAKNAPWEGGFVWKKIKKGILLWLLLVKMMELKHGYQSKCT